MARTSIRRRGRNCKSLAIWGVSSWPSSASAWAWCWCPARPRGSKPLPKRNSNPLPAGAKPPKKASRTKSSKSASCPMPPRARAKPRRRTPVGWAAGRDASVPSSPVRSYRSRLSASLSTVNAWFTRWNASLARGAGFLSGCIRKASLRKAFFTAEPGARSATPSTSQRLFAARTRFTSSRCSGVDVSSTGDAGGGERAALGRGAGAAAVLTLFRSEARRRAAASAAARASAAAAFAFASLRFSCSLQ
mmetsp:Transcript_24011/g.90679  ORF Transcript_24011/g.90679 Transcript_24011/m.90679 type:complete len:248 (-) Transcript_24011:292-1035(-)